MTGFCCVHGVSGDLGLLHGSGLTMDAGVPRQLPAAIKWWARFPDQPFCSRSYRQPLIRTGYLAPWSEQFAELARF